ncbi:hypothetical protein CHUAL_012598 [Chamberlinius hualienensis]
MGNSVSGIYYFSREYRYEKRQSTRSVKSEEDDDKQLYEDDEKTYSFGIFCRKYRLIIFALILALALATLIPILVTRSVEIRVIPMQYSCSIDTVKRIPCANSGVNVTQEQCVNGGCCWDGESLTLNGSAVPKCFHSYPSQLDYTISSISGTSNLTFHLKPWNRALKSFNETSADIQFDIDRVSKSYVRIRAVREGTQVTNTIWPDLPEENKFENEMLYGIASSLTGDRFTLSVYRHSDNTSLIAFNGGPMVYTGNYTEYTIYVPSTNIYGLGEGNHKTLKHSMNFEQWFLLSRSQVSASEGRHYYGVQPFYMCIEETGNVHGVLLGLSQPAIVSLQPGRTISIKTSGELIEVHVFAGPTPHDVMEQYTKVIGRPVLPPYWGLGYHTCRSNGNTTISKQVIDEMENSSIPHESDCGDALVMRSLSILDEKSKSYQDFSIISSLLHNTNRKLLLFQAPTANNDTDTSQNSTFGQGIQDNIFIKNRTEPYIGKVNKKGVAYPDFHDERTISWLSEQYTKLKDRSDSVNIQYDGIFLVDNTPLDETPKDSNQCPSNVHLPPISQAMMTYYLLDNDTICLTAVEPDNITAHYMWHNTYGHDHMSSVISSLKTSALINQSNERVMLAGLSTFAGSGKYGGYWGGDSDATWISMNQSLIQLLEYGLYGIPFTGSPICGFRKDIEDEDLCWKWMQMGSLFPLAFTYYGQNEQPREPTFFDEAFQTMSKDVLQLRYSLLPYIYTAFAQASQTGVPIVRPLFFEFPHDNRTWNNAAQFMLGSSLLVSPSLSARPGLYAYFPAGTWFEFQTLKMIVSENGSVYNLLASQHFPNIYVRSGSVIVTQLPNTTTTTTRLNPYSIWATLDPTLSSSNASGQVYIDDGMQANLNTTVNIEANTTGIWWTTEFSDLKEIPTVNSIAIIGLRTQPQNGTICIESTCDIQSKYDENLKLLEIDMSDYNLNFTENFSMTWQPKS